MEDDENELLLVDEVTDENEQEAAAPEGDDGDIHIEIEGEEAEDETDLVKHLRGVARDAQRRAAELERGQQSQAVEIGKKPDLWDDCEGDPDKFEAAIIAYNGRVQQAQRAEQATTQATQAQAQTFERARINYTAKALQLGIKDPDANVTKVAADLSPDHAGLIMQYADSPATLMAALAANPAMLSKVAAEPDPMRQVIMLLKMEAKVKVTRRGPPPPEAQTIQRGSASLSKPPVDKKAEKLLDDAAKPGGSMTEYNRYMKAKRAAKA